VIEAVFVLKRGDAMDRTRALELIGQKIKTKNLVKHMLAAEAVMRALARRFGEDEEAWGLAGLLHDLDYDLTLDEPMRHARQTAEWIEGQVDPEIVAAILAHPGHTPRDSRMARALYAVDPLTGLIVAAALIHPEKRLAAIDAEFILKRFDEKRFAAGADRTQIRACEELGLPLNEFVATGLTAMQGIARELGL
jgi:putative nucleotidyltransferase with HDIG domain